jgi:ligand-binding sensor domain-containing protein
MKNFKFASMLNIFIFIFLFTNITAAEQFQLQIATDKDTYFTGDKVNLSLGLTNTGPDKTVDLYIAYVYPIDLTYFYTYNGYFFWQEFANSSIYEPGKVASGVFIPKNFSLPLSNLIEFSIPIYAGHNEYPIFGRYNIYFAALDSNTGKLVSNITNTSFSFNKPSGTWTNYPYEKSINCLAMYAYTLWCGSFSGGACSINTITSVTNFYTNANGLIANNITDITVDLDGKIWLATYKDGINVFDANSWIFLNSTTSKIGNEVYSIATDKSGKIWVGYDSHIQSFDGNEWIDYDPKDLSSYVNVIELAPDGKIWFGTQGKGVFVFDGENWINYQKKNSGIVDNDITAIAHDIDRKVWIGTREYGISVFDGENWTTISVSDGLASASIGSIAIDSIGRKWIGASGVGVQVYDNTSWTTYTPENSGLTSPGAMDILIDSKDRCWFASRGLSMFDGNEWHNYITTSNPLFGTQVKEIAVDLGNKKWIYNFNTSKNEYKLFVFDNTNWIEITPENVGLTTLNNINVIFPDKEGKVWIGTMDTGLSVFDGENWQTYNASISGSGFTANWVQSITQSPDGKIWAGTLYEGLYSFDGENWQKINISTGSQNIISNFEHLNFDSSGKLWFSSRDIGLCKYDGVNLVYYNKDNSGFTYDYIDGLAIDSIDRKWIIGRIGDTIKNAIIMFDGDNWTFYDSSNSPLPKKEIKDVTISSNDKIYIGANAASGLFVFDDVDWTVYNSYNSGLLDNDVLEIAIDKEGKKWIGTDIGISVLDDNE